MQLIATGIVFCRNKKSAIGGLQKMAPPARLELATSKLTASCSTIELQGIAICYSIKSRALCQRKNANKGSSKNILVQEGMFALYYKHDQKGQSQEKCARR